MLKKIVFYTFLCMCAIPLAISSAEIVTDANMSRSEALKGVNPDCPEWILNNQAVIEVYYYGFDKKIHKGQIVADCRLADDIHSIFKVAFDMKFPIRHAKPITVYNWDDFESMRRDNTSAFNYREIPFSKRLSKHAYGWAIDINTRENPYFTKGAVYPEGAVYDPKAPGTLYTGHPVVTKFKELGWRWGGDWKSKDYQHFDKTLSKTGAKSNKKVYLWPYSKNQ